MTPVRRSLDPLPEPVGERLVSTLAGWSNPGSYPPTQTQDNLPEATYSEHISTDGRAWGTGQRQLGTVGLVARGRGGLDHRINLWETILAAVVGLLSSLHVCRCMHDVAGNCR